MKKNKHGLLLMSSGLDSFILWRLLDQPQALYVKLGHRYEQKEIATLVQLASTLGSRGLPLNLKFADRLTLGDVEADDAHIPYRNLILGLVAAIAFARAREIYLGALKGEASPDKSRRFFKLASRLIGYTEKSPKRFFAPFIHLTKASLVKRYLERFSHDADLLLFTRSCHSPTSVAQCGQCSACFRRWVAMTANGIEEFYAAPPPVWAQSWLDNKDGRGDLMRRLLNSDPREWLAMLQNNVLALRMMEKYDRRQKS